MTCIISTQDEKLISDVLGGIKLFEEKHIQLVVCRYNFNMIYACMRISTRNLLMLALALGEIETFTTHLRIMDYYSKANLTDCYDLFIYLEDSDRRKIIKLCIQQHYLETLRYLKTIWSETFDSCTIQDITAIAYDNMNWNQDLEFIEILKIFDKYESDWSIFKENKILDTLQYLYRFAAANSVQSYSL